MLGRLQCTHTCIPDKPDKGDGSPVADLGVVFLEYRLAGQVWSTYPSIPTP